ncbi:hypothetical protein M0657_007180 [Pyricularia oryzae]|nr:hypothetical protein M0657_007180 [Pyricularia oryzae]KAI7925508.1 hypothetical protein M9X92_003282 [Pyricularia oryzae]
MNRRQGRAGLDRRYVPNVFKQFTLSPTPSSVSKPGSPPDNPARITGWSAYLACPGPTGAEQALSATHSQCPGAFPAVVAPV